MSNLFEVLIVDDNEGIRELLSEHVKILREDVRISLAVDGSRAWKLCSEKSFDIILTDKVMPIMEGTELIQKLRSGSNRNQSTPILLISSFLERSDAELAKSVGNCYLMSKPIDLPSLQRHLDDAFEKSASAI